MNTLNQNNVSHLYISDIPKEYFLDTDPWDSFYISQRYILEAFIQVAQMPSQEIYLSLYDIPENKELLAIYEKVLGIEQEQLHITRIPPTYYTPTEFVCNKSIDRETYVKSKGKVVEQEENQLSPEISRALTTIMQQHPSQLKIRGYKATRALQEIEQVIQQVIQEKSLETETVLVGAEDTKKLVVQSGKSFLHDDLQGNNIVSLPDAIKEHIPYGRRVSTQDKKEDFHHLLQEFLTRKIDEVVIKPINASSGEGIEFHTTAGLINTLEHYTFPMGDIIVEEKIDIQSLGDVIHGFDTQDPLSVSVQFYDGTIQGEPLIQLTENNDFKGALLSHSDSISKFTIDPKTLEEIKEYSRQLVSFLGLTGNGGLDFLFDKQGRFYFIDPNFGRDTGTLPLRTFEKITNGGGIIALQTKIKAQAINSLKEFLAILDDHGISLFSLENKTGILPISFVAGEHLSVIVSSISIDAINQQLMTIETISKTLATTHESLQRKRNIISNGKLYTYEQLHEILTSTSYPNQ